MRTLLVLGGEIQLEFATSFLKEEKFDRIIAADAGFDTCCKLGMTPDVWVGDFDSTDVKRTTVSKMEIITLCPEKDDTDSEYAMNYAIAQGASEIVVFGALGGRMDHALANLAILGIAMRAGIMATIVDSKNRIRMTDSSVSFSKDEQFGTYLSVIPFGSEAKGVTIEGVKYPIADYDMDGMHSLGVSNEITEDVATVTVREGILIVIESRDY